MKRLIYLITLALPLLFASCQQSIHSGTAWYDTDGNIINAHGGGILYYNGLYYWYGEAKSDTTSTAQIGVSCYSSSDLINWKNEGIALSVSEDADSDIQRGCILERPKVLYNELTQQFVMYFHLELAGNGYASARTGIATADNPAGPFAFVHSLRPNAGILPENLPADDGYDRDLSHYAEWWTSEWYHAVEQGIFVQRDLAAGQMSRDMTLFKDQDGRAYHIYSSEENLTLQIAELSDDYLSYTGRYIRVAPAGHNEAPAPFYYNGHYYMICSGCTGWASNAARLLVADSVMGEWQMVGNPCRGEDAELTFHSQSTYVLPVAGKENLFIFMADRWKPEKHTEGTYIWLPIQLDEELPYIEWKETWNL